MIFYLTTYLVTMSPLFLILLLLVSTTYPYIIDSSESYEVLMPFGYKRTCGRGLMNRINRVCVKDIGEQLFFLWGLFFCFRSSRYRSEDQIIGALLYQGMHRWMDQEAYLQWGSSEFWIFWKLIVLIILWINAQFSKNFDINPEKIEDSSSLLKFPGT